MRFFVYDYNILTIMSVMVKHIQTQLYSDHVHLIPIIYIHIFEFGIRFYHLPIQTKPQIRCLAFAYTCLLGVILAKSFGRHMRLNDSLYRSIGAGQCESYFMFGFRDGFR